MKTYGGAIGHRAMNVPPMLRTFVCKVFCALALTIPTITKTGGYFFVPTMHVSSVFFYYTGFVAVTHGCGISMLHGLRVSPNFRFASPDSWSKIDALVLMACLKNFRKGCVMLCIGGLTLRKRETLKVPLLVCRRFLGRSILMEKKKQTNKYTKQNFE